MRFNKPVAVVVLGMVASWWLGRHELVLDPAGAQNTTQIEVNHSARQSASGQRAVRGIASSSPAVQEMAHDDSHEDFHDHDFCLQKIMDPAMSQEYPPMDPQDLAELKEHIRHNMIEMERDADLFVYTDDGDKIARADILREFEQEIVAFESVPKDQLITYE